MAFPTIPTTAGNTLLSSTTSPANTSHTFPSLTTLAPAAGDLIIAIIVQYGAATAGNQYSSWGASLSEILDDSLSSGTGVGALGVAYKIASGSESGTFTVTSATSSKSVQFLMLIPAATWHGTTAPEVQAATRATGLAADPASFDPANWAAEDTLWISVAGQTETSTTGSPPTLDSPPTNFTGQLIVARVADAVGDITAGVAFRQQNASAQDVGTWTASNANRGNGIATVLAIRPKASVAHTQTPSDTLNLSDSAATAKTIPKTVDDTLARADSLSRVHEAVRTPADSVALSDQLSSAKTIPKAIDNAVALSDNAAPLLTKNLLLDDSLSLSDASKLDRGLAQADSVTLADSLSRVAEMARVLADTVALSDAVAFGRGSVLADVLALADEMVRAVDALRSLSEPVALADELALAVNAVRSLADAVDLADEATPNIFVGGTDHTQEIDDAVDVLDTTERVADYQRLSSEQIALADLLARAVTWERAFSDVVSVPDDIAAGVPPREFDPPSTGYIVFPGSGSTPVLARGHLRIPTSYTGNARRPATGRIARPVAGRSA